MEHLNPYKIFDSVEWSHINYLDNDFPKKELSDLLIPITQLLIRVKIYTYRNEKQICIFFGEEPEDAKLPFDSNQIINELELLVNFMKSFEYELQWIKSHEIGKSPGYNYIEESDIKYDVPYYKNSTNEKSRELNYLDKLRDRNLINYEVFFKVE